MNNNDDNDDALVYTVTNEYSSSIYKWTLRTEDHLSMVAGGFVQRQPVTTLRTSTKLIYSVSKTKSPLGFSDIIPQTFGNF